MQSTKMKLYKILLLPTLAYCCFLLSNLVLAGNWNVPIEARELENNVPITSDSLKKGEAIYADNCVSCHGATGLGDGEDEKVEYSLQSVLKIPVEPDNALLTDGELYWKITHGVAKMPSFAGTLTDEERWLMVNHLRNLPDEN